MRKYRDRKTRIDLCRLAALRRMTAGGGAHMWLPNECTAPQLQNHANLAGPFGPQDMPGVFFQPQRGLPPSFISRKRHFAATLFANLEFQPLWLGLGASPTGKPQPKRRRVIFGRKGAGLPTRPHFRSWSGSKPPR